MLEELKQKVCDANIELQKQSLVIYSWGNVSGIDRDNGLIAIKPSGVAYDELTPDKIVLVDLDGNIKEGELNPSSDTPTHLELYRSFDCGGIAHSHSTYATVLAQACLPVRCMGTTHADYFFGDIPVTRQMSRTETSKDYEKNTGLVIAEAFENLNPAEIPAVLVANHGPFVWGPNPRDAVHHAVIVEFLAKMEVHTNRLNPTAPRPPQYLVEKHYRRKHGANAYYGQQKSNL